MQYKGHIFGGLLLSPNSDLIVRHGGRQRYGHDLFGYDFRDRCTSMTGEINVYEEYTIDNLDRVTETRRKDTNSSGSLIRKRIRCQESFTYFFFEKAYDPFDFPFEKAYDPFDFPRMRRQENLCHDAVCLYCASRKEIWS
jgi:hypothetical protein